MSGPSPRRSKEAFGSDYASLAEKHAETCPPGTADARGPCDRHIQAPRPFFRAAVKTKWWRELGPRGLEVSPSSLLQNELIQRQIRDRLAQPAVLKLKVLHALQLLGLQPTELLARIG
jgi:hypothetical protein